MKQKEGEGRSWLFIEHQGVHRPAAYDLELGSLIPLISALRAIERFPSDKKGGLHFCVIFQIRYFVLVKHCCESVFSVQKEHSSSSCSNRNIQTSWVFGFFFKETSWYFLSNIINHPPIITGAPGITSGSLLTANCEGYNTTDSKAYEFFFFFLHPDSMLMLRNQNYWIAFNLQNWVYLGGLHSYFIWSLGLP